MATEPDTGSSVGEVVRKLAVPAAISAAAGAAGLLMTKKPNVRQALPKLREAASDLPRPSVPSVPTGGVGDLADDLKGKLDGVLGKDSEEDSERERSETAGADSTFDRDELEGRRRERERRRNERRRSRS